MIKKKKLWIPLVLIACFVLLALVGCAGNEFIVEKVEVATAPKTTYMLGESFDISGGMLLVTYSNGSTAYVEFSDERVSFSKFDNKKAGEQLITVRFGSRDTVLKVLVTDVAESIEIVSLPKKRDYIQGETFLARGLSVRVNYEGGETAVFALTDTSLSQPDSDFTLTGYDTETVGTQTLTLSYRNNGNVLNAEFTVTVSAKTVIGFTIVSKPSKENYKLNAELELSDAVFRVSYNNNSPKDVTIVKEDDRYALKDADGNLLVGDVEIFTQVGDELIEGFLNSETGTKQILFRYQGQIAYGLKVNVVLKEIASRHYQGIDVIVKGTPLESLKDYLAGSSIQLVFTDEETKTYTFPEDILNGNVTIDHYDSDSSDDVQNVEFDFGADGRVSIPFTMVEKMIVDLELKDSEDYELTDNALTFYTGDALDVSNWLFRLNFDNYTFVEFLGNVLSLETNLPAGETNFTNRTFLFRTPGSYQISFDYLGMARFEFGIEVLEKTLSGLTVESLPDVTEYTVGERISFEGLKLRADYADSKTGETVRSRSISVYPEQEIALTVAYDNTVAGSQTVTFTLTEDGVAVTANFDVVFKAIVSGIEIDSSSDCKTDYIKGEKFNPAGLNILIHYYGAEDERVTLKEENEGGAWTFAPEFLSVVGTVSVSVGYMGKQTNLNVTVHNDVVSFELRDADGKSFKAGDTFGDITVGLSAAEKLAGYTLAAVRENGETDEMTLPSAAVSVSADNNQSWEAEKTLTVKFTYLGIESVFYMNRLQRKHAYYELSGKPTHLQTAAAGFNAEGLILTEFFDNGTRNVLIADTDFEYEVPEIVFPEGSDRIQADVRIRLKGGEYISFRWGSAGEVSAIPVVFYKKIASKLSWKVLPNESFRINQGTDVAEVLTLIANANEEIGESVKLIVTFTDGTKTEIVLKDNLADFELKDYDASKSVNHTVKLFYQLGTDVKVDLVLRINPKELLDVTFEGYLIGTQGTTEKNTVVEGTDIDYSHAFLNVTYGFYYEGQQNPTPLPAVTLPVQSAWSDFVKQENCYNGQSVDVTITYVYTDGKRPIEENTKKVTVRVTMKGKTVSNVALLKSPKVSYVEGESFTFETENGGEYGELRIIYNNGTYAYCPLTEEHRTTDENLVDPEKFYVVSNEMVDDGYNNVELSNGETKTFRVVLKCAGEEVSYSITLKDRAYVSYAYDMDGASEKLYGDSVKITLKLSYNGEPVSEGERRYRFRNAEGKVFEPTDNGGFTSEGAEFVYLPCGKYTITAVYDGVEFLYNAGEQDVGTFDVLKKTLTLRYGAFDSVTYGDKNPDFLRFLTADGFAAGESLQNLIGYGTEGYKATFLRNGVVSGEPKNATSDGNYYFVGVEGLSADNYDLILPGEEGNPYGVFRIEPLPVYVIPKETTAIYGDAIPQIQYQAYGDADYSIPLDPKFGLELIGAPDAYYTGTSLDGETEVSQPNAGKYELNVAVMREENPNFRIFVESGKFVTIRRAPLRVSYRSKSVTYGEGYTIRDVLAGLVVEGFKRNDEGNVAFDVAFRVDEGAYLAGDELLAALKNAKSYTLTAGEMRFANYDVESVTDGTFTVNPKSVTVTPNATAKVYGTEDPALTYSVDGLLDGDALNGSLSRESGEDVLDGAGYAITLGTLSNPNYKLTLSTETRYLRIDKRELVLTVKEEKLKKFYDGYAPSIDEYTLTLADGGAAADDSVYIQGTAPDRSKIRLTFSSMSPDKTSATTPLAVFLVNEDGNHSIVLAANYKYSIERLPVEIEWLKVSLDGTSTTPFEYGSSYPYIYGQKHYITARVKTEGLDLNPDRVEDLSVSFTSAFDQYYDKATGYYGVSKADTYLPSITGVVNSNFTLSTAAQSSTRIVITANTVSVSIAESARSKFYDRATASVDTRDVGKITLYERAKDAYGALLPTGNLEEITDVDYKTAVVRILNFTVGNKPNGVSDVADNSDNSYQITMTVSDPTLGANFKAEFRDAESQKYFIRQRPITIEIYGQRTKVYDGDAPFIAASQLSSSDASYVTASNLQDMLRYAPTDDTMETGDVGTYSVSVDTQKYQNYAFTFKTEYSFTITKKEIYVTLTEGSGYYQGEKQLNLAISDVKPRDNNLGRGDRWEDVFPSLRFQYEYQRNESYPVLNDGNLSGEKGNVGDYKLTLDSAGSVHKNYTFVWYGSDLFTVKPAEVSILPDRTSLVYGEAEDDDAVYRTAYRPSFTSGSDGTDNGSVFLNLDAVLNHLKLDRANKDVFDVGYYNVTFDTAWSDGCVDGVYADLPNYRVSLSEYDGANRFQITKRPITVKISNYEKEFGTALKNDDLKVEFPNLAEDLKYNDTLETILDSYGLIRESDAIFRFTQNVSYRYTYLGHVPSASANPMDVLANSTREPDGSGGIYGYRMEFTSLPNMKNYEFEYAEDGKGSLTIAPKTLTVTVDSFRWTYRDAWKTGEAGADETYLNLGDYFKISGKVSGDSAELKYPILEKDGGFKTAYAMLTEGNAGSAANIVSGWFDIVTTNTVEWNRNYVYDFSEIDGAATATVGKAELRAVLRTSAGANEITKTYGILPKNDELKILYTGFRGNDIKTYEGGEITMITTPAKIPNFVAELNEINNIAVLYSVGEHRIAPDGTGFESTNYTLVTDIELVENPFVFKVTKKNLTVKSAPVGGGDSVLKKFFGTPLVRNTDYTVSFGDGMGGDFVTSVALPDGQIVIVSDNDESVFFQNYPDAEWVSYDNSVNVVRNVAAATEIEPNIAYMNEVAKNYQVSAVVGQSLQLEIYNRLQSAELGNKTGDDYYAYIAKAKNGETNQVRVKLTYIDGERVYIDLPLDASEQSFTTEKHILNFSVADYLATVTENQSITLNVWEENELVKQEAENSSNAITTDRRELPVTVRNVPTADKTVSSEYLDMTFVGTPLDARKNAIEKTVTYTNSAPNSAARFNLAEISFQLMRTTDGGTFDVQFYNAKTKDAATHRYTVRVSTDTRNANSQTISVYEQEKNGDAFESVDSITASATLSVGSVDLFDEAAHRYRFFINKLTNTLNIEIDGVVMVTHIISKGELQGAAGESAIGIAIDKAFGYVTKIALSEEGYSSEDAVRIVANSEKEKNVPLGLEPYARIKLTDYFAFLWNYAGDFYGESLKAPELKFYLDGAETSLSEGMISLSAGSYRVTAKAFRDSMELSSATVILTVTEGYYVDSYIHLNGDNVIEGEEQTPSVNTPVTLSGDNGGKVYQGKTGNADYSHYRLDFTGIDLSDTAHGAYTRTVDINIKSSDPTVTAFTAAAADVLYCGLTLRVLRTGDSFTTSLKLVAGDGTDTVRPTVLTTTAIDWKKTGGVYSLNVTFDEKNLYVRAEILFNGKRLYLFNLDGRIDGREQEQDAETATGRADVNNLAAMKEKAPISWAVATLANLRAGHSLVLDQDTAITVMRAELNTNTDETTDYIKTISTTSNNVSTLQSSFAPNRPDGISDAMTVPGSEVSYMIGENGFAEPDSKDVRAGVYEYNTYGVRFKATERASMTNKLRFILAENAPKTAADDQNRYSAKAMRNVSLTFIRRSGEKTKLYFSFNDSVYNTGMAVDEGGEAKNFRYEQELFSFDENAELSEGQYNLFDGKTHTVVVTFDKNDNNVEVSSGLVNTQTLGNYVKVYIDGKQIGGSYLFPAYNNVSPWYYTDENGDRKALAAQTTAPFYDRYFLDGKTSAGLAFRGIDIEIEKLAVSAKANQTSFLNE